MSPIVSEQYQFVIGVDTHAATHTFAVLAAATGGPAQGQLPQALAAPWAGSLAGSAPPAC